MRILTSLLLALSLTSVARAETVLEHALSPLNTLESNAKLIKSLLTHDTFMNEKHICLTVGESQHVAKSLYDLTIRAYNTGLPKNLQDTSKVTTGDVIAADRIYGYFSQMRQYCGYLSFPVGKDELTRWLDISLEKIQELNKSLGVTN